MGEGTHVKKYCVQNLKIRMHKCLWVMKSIYSLFAMLLVLAVGFYAE